MDSSYLSLLIFVIITILYYSFIKTSLTTSIIEDSEQYLQYSSANNISLLIYLMLVIVSQFGLNASIISTKCGGSITQNIGSAFLMTFIPWIFIFGGVMAILFIFPGFKSAFSNVIGYFAVAGRANNILTELLENTGISKTIDDATVGNTEKNQNLKSAADAIIKLCGNMSILINQIVPSNFTEYWTMLIPLMKDKYRASVPVELKQELLNTVVLRDNIGEALWYIYTAVLLISIVQYKIASTDCNKDLSTLQEGQEKFQKEQAQIVADNKQTTSKIYTING